MICPRKGQYSSGGTGVMPCSLLQTHNYVTLQQHVQYLK